AWSEVPRGMPLFESIFIFESYPRAGAVQQGAAALGGVEIHTVERTNYALTVAAVPGDRLQVRIDPDRARFDAATIQRMLGHLSSLLASIAQALGETPQTPLAALPMLSATERHQLVCEWNPPRVEETES